MSRKYKALIIITAVSIIATYLLYFAANNFVHIVDRSLFIIFNIRMASWELMHIVFALSISSLPLFAWMAWTIRRDNNYVKLLQYNAIALITFLVLSVVPFFYLLIIANQNPYSSQITIRHPNELFWNFVLIITSLLTGALLILHGLKRRSRNSSYTPPQNITLDN